MQPCTRTFALLALFALFAACAPARSTAQTVVEQNIPGAGFDQPDQSASNAPTIHVYSRETLVDVTATDDKGNPIHGLTRADFTLTEDNMLQPIRSFREFVNAKQPPPPPPGLLTHTAPSNSYTNRQTAAGPLTVLLLDDINGGDNAQVRLALASYFKKMAPGSQAALLALADHLTVLQGPTTDPARLRQVANVIVRPYAVVSDPVADPCNEQNGWQTLEELDQVADYLSHIEGRKNLIWLGNGIPDMIFGSCKNWIAALQKTYDQLEDAEVTVYPVDSAGVVGPPPPPAPLSTVPRYYGQRAAAQNMDAAAARSKTHLAQVAVAEATGGKALYNTNDISGAIDQVAYTGSNYYTLSYAPPSVAYDGRYHAIDIQVDKPGVRLVYRKGYSAEDPKVLAKATPAATTVAATPDPLAVALAPTMPPATQLLFDVKAEPNTEPPNPTDPHVFGALDPKLKDKPLTRYGFLFTVPADQIAFSAAGDGTYNGSVEFEVAAYDTDGHPVTSRSQTMPFPLTGAEYGEFVATPFQFYQQLDLPAGVLTLRVGVLDGVSKKVGTIDIPVTVAKPAAQHAAVVTR